MGLALQRESGRGRKSVGSRDRGGKAANSVAGSLQIDAAKARPGSTCRWKALCTADVAPFDEGAAEPALALRSLVSIIWIPAAEARQRASEVGRQPGIRLKTPWPSSPLRRAWSTRPKLEARRQSRVHLRLGHRQTMARRRGCLPTSVGRSRGRHGSRRALGTRTVLGCSFRKSVAEVGKKHLPSRTRSSLRGEPKLRPGSTFRRRSPDKKRHPGTGEKGASLSRDHNCERDTAHSIALHDRGSSRRKASWVWVFATL